jgi:hypothetical protein
VSKVTLESHLKRVLGVPKSGPKLTRLTGKWVGSVTLVTLARAPIRSGYASGMLTIRKSDAIRQGGTKKEQLQMKSYIARGEFGRILGVCNHSPALDERLSFFVSSCEIMRSGAVPFISHKATKTQRHKAQRKGCAPSSQWRNEFSIVSPKFVVERRGRRKHKRRIRDRDVDRQIKETREGLRVALLQKRLHPYRLKFRRYLTIVRP